MFKLEELPMYQLGGTVAGTDYEKLIALVDAYVGASNKLYVTRVQTPEFVTNQQVTIALGRALIEALGQVTGK